ncbi:hypothetical protein GCM10011588_37880 [Nocardia jinanensis]|uniref:Uncharacterized protein n=1 Tax=Nocardia jinanensis TaxID=382504 RepID=A0A917RRA4_9NOCA|nr:hypothetical protein [Nocardia jinanensis]GGL19632.1 hypothetical protein GCM10011588_37880 [Nocardia jinanensis]
MAALYGILVFPGGIGAVAVAAEPGQTERSISRVDGLSWTGVVDSGGVPLADYSFLVDRGGLSDPGGTVLWTLLGLEFVGYMVIVTTAIWFIGYALGFEWMEFFSAAFRGVAEAISRQLADPVISITAATLGAFVVAWFIIRGSPARAARQIVTMAAVAVFGGLLLFGPVPNPLSADGWLAQGRNVGIAVAAGLNGSDPDPDRLVETLSANMSDDFARNPVQVWNFGHVLDDRCGAVWNEGVAGGEVDGLRADIAGCGDTAAAERIAHPTTGQLGIGVLLLLCGAVLLVFAVVLAGLVVRCALDSIYHGILAIFGFAAGGYIYGPTQTFLVRNIVTCVFAAVRMCAFTVFLGIYLLFLGNLFHQAPGQVVAVIVITALVEIVAISQIFRLRRGLARGSGQVTEWIGAALRGRSTPGSGGGGGGGLSAGRSEPGVLGALGALNTLDNSPLVAWVAAGTVRPFDPLARGQRKVQLGLIASSASMAESFRWGHLARHNWRLVALREAERFGGVRSEMGVARTLKMMRDNRIPDSQLAPVLRAIGAPDHLVAGALEAFAVQEATRSQGPYGFLPLQKTVAAAFAANHWAGEPGARAFAAQAVVAAEGFARHSNEPAANAVLDQDFIRRVEQNWDSGRALRAAITPGEWNSVGRDTRWSIGSRLSAAHLATAQEHYDNPTKSNRDRLLRSAMRVANLDHIGPAEGLDPWQS